MLLKRVIDFRPERAHDIFAGGRLIAKLQRLEVEMFVAPGRERLAHGVAQFFNIGQRTRTLVIFTADCRLCDVAMAMSARVIAFPKELRVLRLGKRRDMQTMGSAKRFAHSQEHSAVTPSFRKKIMALMQANPG